MHAGLLQRDFDRHIGHQRADGAVHLAIGRDPVLDQHVQQFVAVVQAACRIDHLQTVGVAIERNAEVRVMFARTARTSASGAVAPTPSLMLKPFGATPIGITSAPSSWNTCGATSYAAPCAQSTTSFRPRRSNAAGNVLLQNSM